MIVSPLRGEAQIEGTDKKLVFDVNAFCLAERASGKTTDEIVALVEADKADLFFLRLMIWAGLQRHHECTVAEAGDIVSDIGVRAAKAAMMAGLAAAFGVKAEGEESSRPRKKAAVGTG